MDFPEPEEPTTAVREPLGIEKLRSFQDPIFVLIGKPQVFEADFPVQARLDRVPASRLFRQRHDRHVCG